jgi:hypothetical protein
MAGHNYKFHCQATDVQKAKNRLILRLHIYCNGQADEV